MLRTDHARALSDDVLGCRMRRQSEVGEEVPARAGRYREVAENLEINEVRVAERRHMVCRNPIEAEKDAQARQALLAKLEETLAANGPKALLGNKGFARFVKVAKGSVTIDPASVERDAHLDGRFVLIATTDLPADEVALTYKSLWRVERAFREQKSSLEVRPMFRHGDDTSIGHIAASFLAMRLEVDRQRRLDEHGVHVSWPSPMRDLARVQVVRFELDNRRYLLRTDLAGSAHHAFAAAGLRPPPRITPLPLPGA